MTQTAIGHAGIYNLTVNFSTGFNFVMKSFGRSILTDSSLVYFKILHMSTSNIHYTAMQPRGGGGGGGTQHFGIRGRQSKKFTKISEKIFSDPKISLKNFIHCFVDLKLK